MVDFFLVAKIWCLTCYFINDSLVEFVKVMFFQIDKNSSSGIYFLNHFIKYQKIAEMTEEGEFLFFLHFFFFSHLFEGEFLKRMVLSSCCRYKISRESD